MTWTPIKKLISIKLFEKETKAADFKKHFKAFYLSDHFSCVLSLSD